MHLLPLPPDALLVAVVVALALAGCGLERSEAGQTPGGDQAAARLATDGLQDWGCGHAFTVGTMEQGTRLSLWFAAPVSDGGRAVPQPGTEELGSDWTGELVAGSDLFAQWCDDVITPEEPEVVQADEWAVEGTLSWELERGDGQCPSVAIATLSDATVVVDGRSVPIGDVEFRNEHFGCLAG